MAVVVMGHGATFKFSTELVGCIYCDKCGSFKIGRRVTAKNLIWILAAAIIPFLLWYGTRDRMALLGSFFCFGWILLFLIPVLELGYRCKKCGNAHITYSNVLGYPEYDRTVLDVPYEATKKLYKEGY